MPLKKAFLVGNIVQATESISQTNAIKMIVIAFCSRDLTYLEYFVVLNGTIIIGSQSASVELNDAVFCAGCSAIPVPFVEVKGHLTSHQIQSLTSSLNPSGKLN